MSMSACLHVKVFVIHESEGGIYVYTHMLCTEGNLSEVGWQQVGQFESSMTSYTLLSMTAMHVTRLIICNWYNDASWYNASC